MRRSQRTQSNFNQVFILMDWRFILESFDSISADWSRLQAKSPISHIFSSPEWTRAWWQHFGSDFTLYLGSVKKQGKTIGIAPLQVKDNTVFFIGSIDVCDYLDFIVESGEEKDFFNVLLDNLVKTGFSQLNLSPVRPDSTVVAHLINTAHQRGLQVSCQQINATLDMNLPATWEEYLKLLTSKQRYELKRKLRRLAETGRINYRSSTDANLPDTDILIKLFRVSREDKAAFLTPKIEAFFRSLFNIMAQLKLLRLSVLELNNTPIAATTCFEYKDTVYLYNSGYDPEFGWLSPGVISKAVCIQDSIHRGKKRFDFLKGNEEYKYHLGGHELPLYRCSVKL